MAGQEEGHAGGERADFRDAAARGGGQRGQGRHARRLGFREPVHRRRQPGCAEAVAGNLSGQDQNDLHRPAL